ncbi:MAG: hypothetical protein DME26_03700 [Verrucomicrobia bacterium]|nr:MAG: hypothetical protein DME26_03700 [Verrucomicrobiota bacterium]
MPRSGARASARFNVPTNQPGFKHIPNIYVLEISRLSTVAIAIAAYQNSGLVDFAEPDYIAHTTVTTPNDPKFTGGTLLGVE